MSIFRGTTVTLILAFCCLFVSCKDSFQKNKQIEAAVDKIENEQRKLANKAEQEGGLTNEDLEPLLNSSNSMASKLESMGGEEASLGRVLRAVNEDNMRLSKILDSSLFESGMDFEALYLERDYEERIALIEKYEKANQEVLAYVKEGKGLKKAKAALDKEKVSKKNRTDFIGAMTRTANKQRPHLITIRNCDTELTTIIKNILILLKKEDGKWEMEGDLVNFESDETLESFNKAMEEILVIAQNQGEAQQKLLR